MTTFVWTGVTSGQNLGTFTTADVVDFTGTNVTPFDNTFITWDGTGFTINAAGKQATFNITGGGRALADTNFLFTAGNAGKVLIGDNTSDTSADDNANTINGTALNDRLFGLGGDDSLTGGAGDDAIILGNGPGAFGADSVDGGSNFGNGDWLGVGPSNAHGIVMDFDSHTITSPDGSAVFSGIENGFGTSGDDQFYAFEASRAYTGRFFGTPVVDFTRVLEGYSGNDLFEGDQRDGLTERVRYTASPNGVYVNLAEETALDGYDSDTVTAGIQSYTDTLRFIDDIQGSAFNDTLLGGGLATTGGGFVSETFEGMAGNDLIDGNGGTNINLNYNNSPSAVILNLALGTAQDGWDSNSTLAGVQSYTDTIIGGTVSTFVNGSNFDDRLTGDDSRTFLQGRGGNDTLDGAGGLDTAVYGYNSAPIDSVTGVNVDLANPTVDLTPFGLGIDTLISIEGLRGGDLNDTLRGQNNVDNELDGRAGADVLDGRSGNDRVRYDASPNAVNVNLLGGTASDGYDSDSVTAGVQSYTDTLVSIENVRGSKFGDTIAGSGVANAIEGFLGSDSMNGAGGIDTLEFRFSPGAVVVNLSLAANLVVAEDGWGFADKSAANFENVVGGAGDDLITGSDVANRLDGNTGADTLVGGLGNDTLVVDNEADSISDAGGTDTVESLIDFSLAGVTGFENLTLLDPGAGATVNPLGNSPAIRATGNTVKNILIGNSAANVLDGGAGNDDMRGGKGNDTYVVAQALDLVKENANEGIDTVKASVSVALSANVENLILTGALANDGTGNDRPNSIKGNAAINSLDGGGGNDTLDGGGGADEMVGGAGNDQFIWDATDTMVDGGAGSQDRLIVQGAGKALNLNTLNTTDVVSSIEVFDIHGTGNNSVTISAATALSMGGDLTIFGNTGDAVTLNGTGTWTENSLSISYQGHIFHVWSNDLNGAEILIETAITVGQT